MKNNAAYQRNLITALQTLMICAAAVKQNTAVMEWVDIGTNTEREN